MKIKGFEKLTLIDYPDKFACIVFLFGCNFRCGFCHNPELVVKEENINFTENEILDFLKKRIGKLDGVCITGGEPLLGVDENFLIEIKKLGFLIKIDTNGSLPDKLKSLIDKKLVDFIAMDIKGEREEYKNIVDVNVDLSKIENSIKLIVGSGLDYEFRTTIIEDIHSKENLIFMSKWINEIAGEKPKKIFLQGFRNSGKFINEKFNFKKNTSNEYLEEMKNYVQDYFEEVGIRI